MFEAHRFDSSSNSGCFFFPIWSRPERRSQWIGKRFRMNRNTHPARRCAVPPVLPIRQDALLPGPDHDQRPIHGEVLPRHQPASPVAFRDVAKGQLCRIGRQQPVPVLPATNTIASHTGSSTSRLPTTPRNRRLQSNCSFETTRLSSYSAPAIAAPAATLTSDCRYGDPGDAINRVPFLTGLQARLMPLTFPRHDAASKPPK